MCTYSRQLASRRVVFPRIGARLASAIEASEAVPRTRYRESPVYYVGSAIALAFHFRDDRSTQRLAEEREFFGKVVIKDAGIEPQ
jgi:predicted membrane chloride channel (bestrophin family)